MLRNNLQIFGVLEKIDPLVQQRFEFVFLFGEFG
jgi:hypothetical protein